MLLFLNTYADTYSYALTKAMCTGIPIFYNNIGAFIERIPSEYPYFKCFNEELNLELNSDVAEKIAEKMTVPLDYIIKYQSEFELAILTQNIIGNIKATP